MTVFLIPDVDLTFFVKLSSWKICKTRHMQSLKGSADGAFEDFVHRPKF
jgi:hypothetical protein